MSTDAGGGAAGNFPGQRELAELYYLFHLFTYKCSTVELQMRSNVKSIF